MAKRNVDRFINTGRTQHNQWLDPAIDVWDEEPVVYNVSSTTTSTPTSTTTLKADHNTFYISHAVPCQFCGVKTLTRCDRCTLTYYCRSVCQSKDLSHHKEYCDDVCYGRK